MHLTQRSLQAFRVRPALLGALALIAALLAAAVPTGPVSAAPRATIATFQGTRINGTVLATSPSFPPAGAVHSTRATSTRPDPLMFRARSPGGPVSASAAGRGAPLVSGSSLATNEGALLTNFDGASDTQNKAIAGFHDTPPDQGLCVGTLTGLGGKVVIEVVNSIFTIYTPSGKLLAAFSLAAGFMDPNAFSDPRCFFDPTTNSFYMTVISCAVCGPPGTADSVDDVLVVSSTGKATTYQFDTSLGATCFGDQPHTGFDTHALYVATDEFCGPSGNVYEGALLIAISKSQLAAQGPKPNAVRFGPLSLGGIPILTLEPAFGNDSGTEYLLNSFPFDQFGNSNSIANTLGFWNVTGDQNITAGTGAVTLNGQIIQSETYAFPMPAASTGTGAVTCEPSGTPPPCATGNIPITSEAFLNPDDSRMLQVQLIRDEAHGLQLYAALDSAVTIGGDPSARDGIAWFVLNPTTHSITRQGYVAVSGAYLLYPAILHTQEGTTSLAFTITSTSLNPSAARAVQVSTSPSFGPVTLVAAGHGAHVSFSDVLFGRARWGDYSAETLDPNSFNIWSATEYIGPPPGGTDLIDNWGTRVWDMAGDQ